MEELENVESKIITLRNQQVILDCDVAELYGVQTKEINQAVKNNPEKFPDGYIFPLEQQEFSYLRSKFLTANWSKMRTLPKAFTEKGLYMLATILKSPQAVQTTIAIVEAYAKLRELARVVMEIPQAEEDGPQQKTLLKRSGQLVSEILDSTLPKQSEETSFELNLAMVKFKHSVKREHDDEVAALKKELDAARNVTVQSNDEQNNEKLCQQFERQNDMIRRAENKQTAEDKDQWALKQKRLNVECLLKNVKVDLPLPDGILKQIDEYADMAAKKNLSGYENELIRYCESALSAGNTKPVEMLYAHFATVGNHPALNRWLKEQAKAELKEPVDATRLQELLNKAEIKYLKRCGCTQDEFYTDNQTVIENCIDTHFGNTEDLEMLQRQAEQITCVLMKRFWQSKLDTRRNDLEGKYILSANSVDELRQTRQNLFAGTSDGSAMDRCCKLVDQYTSSIETLSVTQEHALGDEVIKQIRQYSQAYEACGDFAQHMGQLVHNPQVSKQCGAFGACQKRSFRHACSAFMVKAATKSSEVDWTELLGEIFTKDKLTKAVKAPFKKENLPILQRLLALDDFVGSTEMYDAFMDAVMKNSLLSQYIPKIKRDKKNFQLYVDERKTRIWRPEP